MTVTDRCRRKKLKSKNTKTLAALGVRLIDLGALIGVCPRLCPRLPNGIFTTQQPYDYWSRDGEQAKDKQRATFGHGRFRYAIRPDSDGIYTMHHFDGIWHGVVLRKRTSSFA